MRDTKPFALMLLLLAVVTLRFAHADELLWIAPGQGGARSVAVSNDTIATGDWDGSILLWRRADRKFLRTLRGHNSMIKGLAFAPDGSVLASASNDGTLRVWNVATGNEIALDDTGEHYVNVGYLAKSNQVVALELGGNLKFYSAANLAPLGKIDVGVGSTAMALSPDGDHVATAFGHDVRLWSLPKGNFQNLTGHIETVQSLAFSADGSQLASGSGWPDNSIDRSVRIWDVATGAPKRVLNGHPTGVYSLAFNPATAELASASYDGTLNTWNVSTGDNTASLFAKDGGALAFSPNASTFAVGNQTVDLATEEFTPLCLRASTIQGIAFSPDGALMMADDNFRPRARGSLNGDLRVELKTAPPEKSPNAPPKAADGPSQIMRSSGQISFSPDRQSVYLKGRVWSLGTGESTFTIPGQYASPFAFMAPDWNSYLTSSIESTNVAELRNYNDAAIVNRLFNTRSYWSKWLAFAADGSKIASVGGYQFPYGGDFVDPTVRIWNTIDGSLARELTGTTVNPYYVEFSPDGNYVATAAEANGNEVCVWDLRTGKQKLRLSENVSAANSIAFFPDGDLIAWGHEPGIEIWNITSSNRVAMLTNEIYRVTAVAIDANARRLAFGRVDGSVGVAAIPFGQPLKIKSADTQNIVLTFQTAPDQIYTLQTSADYKIWTAITNFPGPASITSAEISVPITTPNAAFQLKIETNSTPPTRTL